MVSMDGRTNRRLFSLQNDFSRSRRYWSYVDRGVTQRHDPFRSDCLRSPLTLSATNTLSLPCAPTRGRMLDPWLFIKEMNFCLRQQAIHLQILPKALSLQRRSEKIEDERRKQHSEQRSAQKVCAFPALSHRSGLQPTRELATSFFFRSHGTLRRTKKPCKRASSFERLSLDRSLEKFQTVAQKLP